MISTRPHWKLDIPAFGLTYIFLILVVCVSSCKPTKRSELNKEIRDMKSADYGDDGTFIYMLPYEIGTSQFYVQGWHSKLSHEGEYSMDFKIEIGTNICAARSGEVVACVDSFSEGGLDEALLNKGNHVIILHDDSTYAGYWHLNPNSLEISKGDHVLKGQVLGQSGHTGYSAFPHLHFMVFTYTSSGSKQTRPARFSSESGPRYLKPGSSYKCTESY